MTIRELRMKHNLTQTELGEKTGVSQQTIARYETGRAQIPQAFVAKIVHHFNITLEEGWQMMEQVPKKDRRTRRGPYIGAGAKK